MRQGGLEAAIFGACVELLHALPAAVLPTMTRKQVFLLLALYTDKRERELGRALLSKGIG